MEVDNTAVKNVNDKKKSLVQSPINQKKEPITL